MRALALCVSLLLLPMGCAPTLRGQAPAAAVLKDAEPCRVPFESYEAYLAFLREKPPGDTRDERPTEAQLREAYPRPAFEALAARDGRCLRLPGTGERPRGFLLRPRPLPGVRWPLLVFLRGGLLQDSRITLGDLVELQTFAARGYVVVAPEYRPDDALDELGGAENRAVDARIAEALALPEVDARQRVVFGVSRGAVNAFQLARRMPGVNAVATLSGLVDARASLVARPELAEDYRLAVKAFASHPEEVLAARSPITWVRELRMPTLLVHGAADWRVDLEQARRFAAQHGALQVYEDGHSLWAHRAEARTRIDRFFRRALLPPVPLNHLYVVLDAETFGALASAPFWRERFAGVDGGLPDFAPIGPGTKTFMKTLYVRGRDTYLELMSPENTFGEPLGKVGLGFGVEQPGALARVFASLESAALRPWFSQDYVTFAGTSPVPWKQTTGLPGPLAPGLDVWTSEYHPDFIRWLGATPPSPEGILRRDFLAPRMRRGQLLENVIGFTLGLAPAEAAAFSEGMQALGFTSVQATPERLGFEGPSLAVRVNLRPGSTRLEAIAFQLSSDEVCDETFGKARLVCAGGQATLTLP